MLSRDELASSGIWEKGTSSHFLYIKICRLNSRKTFKFWFSLFRNFAWKIYEILRTHRFFFSPILPLTPPHPTVLFLFYLLAFESHWEKKDLSIAGPRAVGYVHIFSKYDGRFFSSLSFFCIRFFFLLYEPVHASDRRFFSAPFFALTQKYR